MPLSPGDKLGPYEILAPIGAGGFGEVYKALEPGKEVEAAKWVGRQAADDEIEACRRRAAAENRSERSGDG